MKPEQENSEVLSQNYTQKSVCIHRIHRWLMFHNPTWDKCNIFHSTLPMVQLYYIEWHDYIWRLISQWFRQRSLFQLFVTPSKALAITTNVLLTWIYYGASEMTPLESRYRIYRIVIRHSTYKEDNRRRSTNLDRSVLWLYLSRSWFYSCSLFSGDESIFTTYWNKTWKTLTLT